MNAKNSRFADDRTANERRRNLSDKQMKELQLAGGVEGGMQAGSAGGPRKEDVEAEPNKSEDRSVSRGHSSTKRPSH